MNPAANSRRGFTATELLIVLLVIGLLIGMGLSALSVLGAKSNLYGTGNSIMAVHHAMRRCAMQFGSAGMVYGYIVSSKFTHGAGGPGVAPFAIRAPVAVGGANTLEWGNADLRAEISSDTPFWSGNSYIYFKRDNTGGEGRALDLYMPGDNHVVLFAPRTGYVHRNVRSDGYPIWRYDPESQTGRTVSSPPVTGGSLYYPENCLQLASQETGLFQRLSGGGLGTTYPANYRGNAGAPSHPTMGRQITLYKNSVGYYSLLASPTGDIRLLRVK